MSEPPIPGVYYVDGRFVPPGAATVSATDLAVLRGMGVFDSLRTYAGRPFMLEAHLDRLENSARMAGLALPWTRSKLVGIIEQVLARSPYEETSLRIVVTGGEGANFFTPQGRPSLIVIGTELKPYPAELYQSGIKVATAALERPLPGAKTTDYLHGHMALKRARQADPEVFEVIYVDRHDRATEGVTSNLFAFFDEFLVTPGTGVLPGVTRQLVLDLAGRMFQVQEADLPVGRLRRADEIFITATIKEIMPVREFDDVIWRGGAPGPNTRRLMDAFQALVAAFTAGRDQAYPEPAPEA